MMKRFCKECSKQLYGRLDKRFCTDGCRSSFNNKRYKSEYAIFRKINQALRRNRNILKQIADKDYCLVHKMALDAEGFNFQIFNSVFTIENGHQVRFCYDYGYILADDEEVFVISPEIDYGSTEIINSIYD